MNGRRLILAGTSFYGYVESIGRALVRSGVDTHVIGYPNLRNGWRSAFGKLGVPWLEDSYRRALLSRLRREAQGSQGIVLVRGDLLYPEDIESLRQSAGVPVVLWLIDAFESMRQGLALCMAADLVLCYSLRDAKALQDAGKEATFLPLAYDPAVYRPIPGCEQDLDLYFVGNYHEERRTLLEELLGSLEREKLKIVMDGPLASRARPGARRRLVRDYPRLARTATGRRVSHAHINQMTNRARINLNVLPNQATWALNIRAYEICGAGGFQVLTRNGVLPDIFVEGEEVVAYDSCAELTELIRRFLKPQAEAERKGMAARGLVRAVADHSFDHRVQQVLRILG